MVKKRISSFLISCLITASITGCSTDSTQNNTPPIWWGTSTGAVAGTLIGAGIKAGAVPFTLIGAGLGAVITAPMQRSSTRASIGKISRLPGAQVIEVGDYVKIVIESDRIFGVANDRLRRDPDPYLDYTADILNNYPKANVTISAFTDNIAAPGKDKELTQRQAQKVLAYLWYRGVDWRRMKAVGCGKEDTVATNRTARGSAANRRIEITFSKPEPVAVFSPRPISDTDTEDSEPKIYK